LVLIKKLPEKYLKKLLGKSDIEDALKGLDKLTNEEVRMVTAQVLKGTQIVNDRVRVVENKVLDGAQLSLIRQQEYIFNSDVLRGKRDKGSRTTSSRRHGSSETLVIFFLC